MARAIGLTLRVVCVLVRVLGRDGVRTYVCPVLELHREKISFQGQSVYR